MISQVEQELLDAALLVWPKATAVDILPATTHWNVIGAAKGTSPYQDRWTIRVTMDSFSDDKPSITNELSGFTSDILLTRLERLKNG